MNDLIKKPKIVVICGPTAIGKTGTAITLARSAGGEIVGADSMQIYRHMEIGTAKPTPAEQAAVPHHLIDVVDPDQPFDAARYVDIAGRAIDRLCRKGVIPFVVGGTGLYIRALIHGIFPAHPTDPELRARLKAEAAAIGSDRLHQRLAACDPAAADRIHPNDAFRIIRALEVFETTGAPLSEQQRRHGFADVPYVALKIGLQLDREILYDRINRRVDAMFEEGLLAEVRKLLAMGYDPGLKSMQSLGYRHMTAYLENRIDWEEARRTLQRDTRRYAKRQMTWFRADPDIHWFAPDAIDAMQRLIDQFLRV